MIIRIFRALATALLLISAVCAQSARYKMTDLGVAPGYTDSCAVAVNNRGEVAITNSIAIAPGSVRERAFLWRRGHFEKLSLPAGCTSVGAVDVNNKGEMLVSSDNGSFAWRKGEWIKISLSGVNPVAINDRGQVALYGSRGYLWQDGRVQRLKMLPKWNYITVYDLNNKGRVLGVAAILQENNEQAFDVIWENRNPRVIKTGGEHVNDLGQIATLIQEKNHEYGAILSRGRKYTLYPPRGFQNSRANAISNRGIVAGEIYDNHRHRACVWVGCIPTDLGTLPRMNSSALAINDSGLICGKVTDKSGHSRAVVWEPVK